MSFTKASISNTKPKLKFGKVRTGVVHDVYFAKLINTLIYT
jgi:hypothetical protein